MLPHAIRGMEEKRPSVKVENEFEDAIDGDGEFRNVEEKIAEIEEVEDVTRDDSGDLKVQIDDSPDEVEPADHLVQVTYGVVDLRTSYPSEKMEFERPQVFDFEVVERSRVVPFKLVKDGFSRRENAERAAERMNEDEGRKRYKAVVTSDTRGI